MSETPATRLKRVRTTAGFEQGTEAARRFGWPIPTYLGHENGMRGFGVGRARAYAEAFKVDAGWLLTGEGANNSANCARVPLAGYVGNGGVVYLADGARAIGGPLVVDLPSAIYDDYAVFKVRGEGNFPAYRDNEIILARKGSEPAHKHLNRECVVRTLGGLSLLRTLKPGSQDGLYYLLSSRGEAMVDAEVFTAWPVEWTRKP
jgi:hypothetical protein